MINAAGILQISKAGRALFLKRGNGGDCPGTWCIPGGRIEDGETTIAAAIRETMEETGSKAGISPAKLILWTRSTNHRETTGAAPTPPPGGSSGISSLTPLAPLGETVVVPGEQVDFTTYLLKDVEEFEPDILLSGETVAYAWAPIDAPPEPLHPGCRIALDRFTMNELNIADAIIAGSLTSPQRYGGFTLFNIRITGTGIAFRARKLGEKATAKDKKAGKAFDADGRIIEREEEYPVRDPSIYLTDEFLQRCHVPVVLEHPVGQKITGEEFNRRTIGTVFKPYIRAEQSEVWAIVKIYDEDAVELMTEHQLSTSPGVVWFGKGNVEGTKAIIDGKNFLFEGNPSLMDHIAVCRQGVWDKGGPPSGVETTIARKDSIDMDKDEFLKLLEENNKKNDTVIGTMMSAVESLAGSLGKVVTRMDSKDKDKEKSMKDKARKDADDFKFSDRKDAEEEKSFKDRRDSEEMALCDMYKACGDSEEEAKEKAAKDRKDAEDNEAKVAKDAEEEEEKKEKAAKDSALGIENKELRERLAKLEERVPVVQPKDADSAMFASYQTRFDDVYTALGTKTPIPMSGESLLNYRRRALTGIKQHSKTYKDAELGVVINDEVSFKGIESTILNEAGEVARTDANVPSGTLRAIEKILPSGHKETTFLGKTADWFAEFSTGRQFAAVQKYNANGRRAGA